MFILLAVIFISSSVNNMMVVSQALDHYFKEADVPDYWMFTTDQKEAQRIRKFSEEKDATARCQEMRSLETDQCEGPGI